MSGKLGPSSLPVLPLLLWGVPPGLILLLQQEGVPFEVIVKAHPMALRRGRFVLYDSRRISTRAVRSITSEEHLLIDVDSLRRGESIDPFRAVVDSRSTLSVWSLGEATLTERVARHNRSAIRRRVLGRLRDKVARSGGLWARLGAFPHPFRSAFNLRVDLDEPIPEDYFRFAAARDPLADCTTHFVSTHAYGGEGAVLRDLRHYDTQSHGHFHHVYRNAGANRRNLRRAHDILVAAGIEPVGFAAPSGRWNAGLDRAIEELGYEYSSDFQVGYDDVPFFPWLGDRFSKVLQVPIHPVCEGLFLEAGIGDPRRIAEHLVSVLRAKVDAGEPAFLYGHPERRLAWMPEVLKTLSRELNSYELIWRATLTEFARWWHWRSQRRWSVVPRTEQRFEIQFEEWDATFPLTIEVVRGAHVAGLPVTGPRLPLPLEGLAYERRAARQDLPTPSAVGSPLGLKAALRSAIDWETVTPLDELPNGSIADRLKRGLRCWRDRAVARKARR
ncbi:hypothetical protein BH23PLA1_BH23PLA1_15740 [soil metagenome]